MCLVASGAQRLGAAWGCTCHTTGQDNPFSSQVPLLPWAAVSSWSTRPTSFYSCPEMLSRRDS